MRENVSGNFFDRWELERKNGLKKYYMRHIGGLIAIIVGIFIASCLTKKTLNIVYLLISMFVVLLFPFVAWWINELRLKKYLKRKEK